MQVGMVAVAAAAASLGTAPAVQAADAGPAPPRDVYLEAPRPDQVVITWRSGTVPLAGEEVAGERYQVLRDGEVVADTTQSKVVDSWLQEHHRYSYVVRAIDEQGRTADASPVQIETPPFYAGLELGPYLQQLSARSVVVVWQTYGEADTSLHFGLTGGSTTVKRNAGLTRRHVVSLSGLAPDTPYTYRWESDGRLGEPGEFRTPVSNPARFSFGVIGDYGIGTPAAAANLRRLSEDSVDFAITTGDNAQIFGREQEYRDYVFGPLLGFMAHRPFWPSIGNHDYYGLANYLRYFALPNGGRYYSFTYGGVLFLSLDSSVFNARQRSWAREKLRSSAARCKVAYFHHPLWSSGPGTRGRGWRRRKFVPLLQRGGVDLVLSGHVQNYERSRPLWSGRRSRRGIVYVVTGGGGAPLTPFTRKRKPRWSARRGLFYHRLRVTAGRHRFKVKAIDTAGRTRDRFSVPCR
jgi:hypothetical protein